MENILSLSTPNSRQQIAEKIAQIAACLAIAFIPYSIALYHVASAIAIVGLLFSDNVKDKLIWALRHPIVQAGLLFFGFCLLYSVLSPVPFATAKNGLHRYSKLLYLIPLLPPFREARWQRYALNVFLISIGITVFITYLKYFGLSHIGNPEFDTYKLNHIETSYLVAFATFVLMHRTIESGFSKLYAALTTMFFFQLFFINMGNTGYLIFFVLLNLFVWQKYGFKLLLGAILITPMLFWGLQLLSPNFSLRAAKVYQDSTAAFAHQNDVSSSAIRIEFLRNGTEIVKERPFGIGFGTFVTTYAARFPDSYSANRFGHPHNEYLYIAMQISLVGLALFLFWCWKVLQTSFNLPLENRMLTQGLLVTFMVGALVECVYTRTQTGFAYIFLLAALSGSFTKKLNNTENHNDNFSSSKI